MTCQIETLSQYSVIEGLNFVRHHYACSIAEIFSENYREIMNNQHSKIFKKILKRCFLHNRSEFVFILFSHIKTTCSFVTFFFDAREMPIDAAAS